MRFQMTRFFGRRATGCALLAAMAVLMVPSLRDLPAVPQLLCAPKTVQRAGVPVFFVENRGQAGDQIDYYL